MVHVLEELEKGREAQQEQVTAGQGWNKRKREEGVRWSPAVKNSVFCSFQGKNCLCCYPSLTEGKAISKDAETCYFTAQNKIWCFKRVRVSFADGLNKPRLEVALITCAVLGCLLWCPRMSMFEIGFLCFSTKKMSDDSSYT